MRKCYTCGACNPAETTLCHLCLDKLGVKPERAQTPLRKRCPACCARNCSERTECYVCAADLGECERVISCRTCGARSLASSRFCCLCSEALDVLDAPGEPDAGWGTGVSLEDYADWDKGNPAAWRIAERRLRAQPEENSIFPLPAYQLTLST